MDLRVLFPLKPSDHDVALRMAQIEHVTNALMVSLGAHEASIERYRNEFVRQSSKTRACLKIQSIVSPKTD